MFSMIEAIGPPFKRSFASAGGARTPGTDPNTPPASGVLEVPTRAVQTSAGSLPRPTVWILSRIQLAVLSELRAAPGLGHVAPWLRACPGAVPTVAPGRVRHGGRVGCALRSASNASTSSRRTSPASATGRGEAAGSAARRCDGLWGLFSFSVDAEPLITRTPGES